MKLNKYLSFSSGAQLWRLLISNKGLLVIESRDTKTKEVFFSCYNLDDSKLLLNNISLPEKIWLGVESVYDDFIFFHKFVKPDMPMHKGIIAFSIKQNKILWENLDYTFLLIDNNKLIVQSQGFEEANYYALDINSGEIVEKLNLSFEELDDKHNNFSDSFNYDVYNYPQTYKPGTIEIVDSIISKLKKSGNIKFNSEYLEINNFYFCNFHTENNGIIKNIFFAVDKITGKKYFDLTLNSSVNAFVPESFFVYKNLLILLVEKKGLTVFKME